MPAISEVFPTLAWCARPNDTHEIAQCTLYDVKFWPWSGRDDEEPIFAFTGGRNLIVCKTSRGTGIPFEIIRWWQRDESTNLNSICWTKTAEGRPLLCAAGSNPRAVIIFDIEHDEPVRELSGHGKAINDLQVSPLSPDILVSASEDLTVRIWNLSPKHEKQPCRAILGGQGHPQPLLTLDFHPNGRWLLTGAMDTAVALWAVPSLEELDSNDNIEPTLYPYPYFISSEIHTNFVDCVKWYGDCILSRAARNEDDGGDAAMKQNEIILWIIDGFDSAMPHPEHPPIPYPGRYTLSAFPHSERSRGFDRLLTFDTKDTARFYLRFGLLHEPNMRPVLVMGNTRSKFFFWDLQKCEEGEEVIVKKGKGGKRKRGAANAVNVEGLDRLGELKRDADVVSDGASAFNTTNSASNSTSAAQDVSTTGALNMRSATDDPMRPLLPQQTKVPSTTLPNRHKQHSYFATSQLSWSPDGKWLVGVGDHGMLVMFHREIAR